MMLSVRLWLLYLCYAGSWPSTLALLRALLLL